MAETQKEENRPPRTKTAKKDSGGGVFQLERLYRSRSDRFIAGVAGGMAEYFRADPTLIRLLWVAAAFLGGVGIILYLAAMVIIPDEGWENGRSAPEARVTREEGIEPERPRRAENTEERARSRQALIGWILLAAGVFFLVEIFVPYVRWDFLFPVLLIGAGVAMLARRR